MPLPSAISSFQLRTSVLAFLTVVLPSGALLAQTQEPSPCLDFPAVFAGNFGELRSAHFHGGLDFKTQGAVGKPVHALWDGYISRIRVTEGAGLILDVTYGNGITAISMHLSSFLEEIDARVLEEQFRTESYQVEIIPRCDEYPVRRGEVIALSGNTGYSFGPHLHLEFMDALSGDRLDPLPYFQSQVSDTTAPRAVSVLVEPYRHQGLVDGAATERLYPLPHAQAVPVWGKVCLALRAYDYMDGAPNQCGVMDLRMEVDGREVFHSHVDRFRPEDNDGIDAWVRRGHMRCWLQPDNHLSMIQVDASRGILDIFEQREYRVRFTLSDAMGNTSTADVRLVGRPAAVPRPELSDSLRLGASSVISRPGMSLVVPSGSLFDDARIRVTPRSGAGLLSLAYRFDGEEVHLKSPAVLSIRLAGYASGVDPGKVYMARLDRNGQPIGNAGAEYDSDSALMRARVGRLGTFALVQDTVPPKVEPVRPETWARDGRIRLRIWDSESGLKSYRAEIDGQWALLGVENTVQGVIVGRLEKQRIEKGRMHSLRVCAEDATGNTVEQTFSFRY